jgi:acetyl esterase/lipase
MRGLLIMATTMMIGSAVSEELPMERPLWPNGIADNPIRYDDPDGLREPAAREGSPSGRNRVFSRVSVPTYAIHRPEKDAGVGLVILPGGGSRDIWIDREGHDLAIALKAYGITSLVLKYRTNASVTDSTRAYPRDVYNQAAQADATEALRILRKDGPHRKVGLSGFSAGGGLTLATALRVDAVVRPDFLGLFYPSVRQSFLDADHKSIGVPPVFMMNAFDDTKTKVGRCLTLFTALQEAGIRSELHVFGRGGHGFDLGYGKGKAVAGWLTSFIAWMRDEAFLSE